MNDLVVIKNDIPVISTFDLYDRMGYKEHRNLKETIDKHIDSFNEFGVMRFETVKPIIYVKTCICHCFFIMIQI